MAVSDDTQHPALMTRLQAWAAHPFSEQLDLFGVTLTVGLVVVLTILWRQVLSVAVEA